jgi:hypothetical protein
VNVRRWWAKVTRDNVELCESWFHSRCQDMSEETYRLLNQDKIHFYCGQCDRVVGKILHSVSELNLRQDKLEGRMMTVEKSLGQVVAKAKDQQEETEEEIKQVKMELNEVKNRVAGVVTGLTKEGELTKLHQEMEDMKLALETSVNTSVKDIRDDIEEHMEIERRKGNLIIHGVPEADAEEDVEFVIELMTEGLKMDFTRNVDKVMRIGRLVDGKARPVRLVLKREEAKKEILARAKQLKDIEKYKKMFVSPDLTRKQQDRDRELRTHLKTLQEAGEKDARIKNGKVVKKCKRRRRGGTVSATCSLEQSMVQEKESINAVNILVKTHVF